MNERKQCEAHRRMLDGLSDPAARAYWADPDRRCSRHAYGCHTFCWQHQKQAADLLHETAPNGGRGWGHVKDRACECLEDQRAGKHCAPCSLCTMVRDILKNQSPSIDEWFRVRALSY